MKNETRRRLTRVFLSSIILLTALSAVAHAKGEGKRKTVTRSIKGIIYWTNDSPDVYEFPVELFNSKFRRIAATRTGHDNGHFEFKGVRPGKYYVQALINSRCLLQYEVDVPTDGEPERVTMFGDAGCGHHQIVGLPAPRPVPRKKKR